MQYFLSILAFVMVVVGVSGDVWDGELNRLTRVGWATIGIAAVTMFGSVYLTWRERRRAAWEERQRAKVNNIAEIEIRDAAHRSLSPFSFYFHRPSLFFDSVEDWERTEYDIDFLFKILKSEAFRARLTEVDLRDGINPGEPEPSFGVYFAKCARDADELLEKAIGKYSAYLSADLLLKVHGFRSNDFFWFRLRKMGELVEMNKDIEELSLDEGTLGQENYDYLNFLDQLYELLKALPHRPKHYRGGGINRR